jgi:hypothetical protein
MECPLGAPREDDVAQIRMVALRKRELWKDARYTRAREREKESSSRKDSRAPGIRLLY